MRGDGHAAVGACRPFEVPADCAHPFMHDVDADMATGRPSSRARVHATARPAAAIADLQAKVPVLDPKLHGDGTGTAGMLADIGNRFLSNPEQGDLDGRSQPRRIIGHAEGNLIPLLFEAVCQ